MCMAAGAAPEAAQPDWASLPADLWRRIAGPAVASPSRGLDAQTEYYRLIATCCSVCSSLRDALLGPDSGALWEHAVLSATHPGLTWQQSLSLNALVTAQGVFAFSLEVHGSDGVWLEEELAENLACFPGLCDHLTIVGLHSETEAAVIGRGLAALPFRSVDFKGTAACLLPATAHGVLMQVLVAPDDHGVQGGLIEQAPFRRFLGCLRPLRELQLLSLQLCCYRLTSADVQQLAARHPLLQHLHLHLDASPSVGPHAIASLRQLSSVQLCLTVCCQEAGHSLSMVLQQLPGLEVHVLRILVEEVSPGEEALLAKCSLQQLIVSFSDPLQRLRRPPAGVTVLYRPP